MDVNRHQGTRAIVTGAASGIGYATAARLVREGATVLACDMNDDGIDALAAELQSDRLITMRADITSQGDIDALVGRLDDINALANVAGIMDGFTPVHDLRDDDWERVLAVNVTGAMRLTRAVLPTMRAAGKGAIVNVGSRASLLAGMAGTAYVTSKHALLGLTRSTAALYGAEGVRCNIVCPGGVETGILASGGAPRDPEYLNRWVPLMGSASRLAKPDEIATLISWLACDEASNVNGATVTDDGGWSIQ